MHPVVLIVEDDPDLLNFLKDTLTDEGYTTHTTTKGTQALKLVEKTHPNLVILDLGLPDISGETVCAHIKTDHPTLPVIILTASSDTQTVVDSFDKGADHYINKPFVTEELLARIKSKLRKQKQADPTLSISNLTLNIDTLEVTRAGDSIDLTQTEFTLLHYLMVNANRVLSREQILSHVWAQDPDIETRVVDVYIGYLRKKLRDYSTPTLIHSKRGFGYVLKTPQPS